MELFAPEYYRDFKCIADKCSHSCCVGWEIDVDDDTLQRYAALTGERRQWLLDSIEQDDNGAHFKLRQNDRCVHLDGQGLCRIISTLGEGYLCDICREHPRFYHRAGNRVECGIGASCEEAARLILSRDGVALVPIGHKEWYENGDTCSGFDVIARRRAVFRLLWDTALPYAERLAAIERQHGVSAALPPSLPEQLEYLDEAHRPLLAAAMTADCRPSAEWEPLCRRFLTYLIYRHASETENEQDFRLWVGVALALEQAFRGLLEQGTDPVRAAVLLSEEMEYSTENMDTVALALSELT